MRYDGVEQYAIPATICIELMALFLVIHFHQKVSNHFKER